MRIAAGVLLVIMGAWNLIGGGMYSMFGWLGSEASDAFDVGARMSEDVNRQAGDQMGVDASRTAQEIASKGKTISGNVKMLGYGLIVLAALQIVGGVMCFTDKSAMFVLAIGAIGLIAELADIMMVWFKLGNGLGIVTAAFAIVAGLQMQSAAKGAPPAHTGGAPPATPPAEPAPPKPPEGA